VVFTTAKMFKIVQI